MLRSLFRRLLKLMLWLMLGSVLSVLIFRWLPPPGTMLMLERTLDARQTGQSLFLQRSWRDWDELPDTLKIAVIAGEDQKFAEHWGFDFSAIRQAIEHNRQGTSLRGASTLSQQTAKNLFLWSGRSWPRKTLEAWFTALIELLWPKQRILEIYLNSAEWGPGIFGAEAAARFHFNTGVAELSQQQACTLAAILPSPLLRSAGRPDTYTQQRSTWICQQVRQLGGVHYLQQL